MYIQSTLANWPPALPGKEPYMRYASEVQHLDLWRLCQTERESAVSDWLPMQTKLERGKEQRQNANEVRGKRGRKAVWPTGG